MVIQSYGAYTSAKHITQPNVEALSPQTNTSRVAAEVLPTLPATGSAASSRILVESLAEQAQSLHKLSATQANAQVRMGGTHSVAWAVTLLLSLVLLFQLWPSKNSAA